LHQKFFFFIPSNFFPSILILFLTQSLFRKTKKNSAPSIYPSSESVFYFVKNMSKDLPIRSKLSLTLKTSLKQVLNKASDKRDPWAALISFSNHPFSMLLWKAWSHLHLMTYSLSFRILHFILDSCRQLQFSTITKFDDPLKDLLEIQRCPNFFGSSTYLLRLKAKNDGTKYIKTWCHKKSDFGSGKSF